MRKISAKSIDPVARFMLKKGITADFVTITGALIACLICSVFLSQGEFFIGGILLSLVGISDLLDGTMARQSNTAGPWGAFLDSTLDRIVDGFLYGSVLFWIATSEELNNALFIAALVAGLTAQITSYARARWESVGVIGKVGLAERSERMIALCCAFILTGFGLNLVPIVIYVLAVASTFTVMQRIIFVRRQLKK